MSRRTQFIVGFIFVAAIIAIGVWFGHTAADAPPTHADSAQPASVAGVFRPSKTQWEGFKVMPVQTMTFQSELVTDGVIANNDDATTPVFSPYSGRVSRLIARLGDVVSKGAPLMMVETSDLIQARNNLSAAAKTFSAAQTRLQQAQAEEQRQHELTLSKTGAIQDWQQSQAELAAVQRAFDSAQSVLSAARDQLRILGNSDAEVEAIEHDPERQKLNPGAYVLAPIAGTVTQRQVGLGQYVVNAAAGASTPVYTISDLSKVWLVANVRESDVAKIRVGQPVQVTVSAYPGKLFNARISWVASAVDASTHRLPVRAVVENPARALKPMMFASFRIGVDKEVSALGVPLSAVVYEGSAAHVWVARDDGTVVSCQVRTGRTSNGMVEILSGLTPGQKVVTSGTLFIDRAADNDNS